MRQTLTLYKDDTQLIRTKSPEQLIDIDVGSYNVDSILKDKLRTIWECIDEYPDALTLEVENV